MRVVAAAGSFVFLALQFTLAAEPGQDAKDSLVELTNKLGVESTVRVRYIQPKTGDERDDDVLRQELETIPDADFIAVQVSKGVYIGLLLSEVKQVVQQSGLHSVTLANGSTLIGKLVAVIKDPDGKVYDLSGAVRLVVKYAPTPVSRDLPRQTIPVEWALRLPEPLGLGQRVIDPRFRYFYWSTEKYIRGGETRQEKSETFFFLEGNDSILANLTDFEAVSIESTTITVKAKGGKETIGKIGFRPSERSRPEAYSDWYLVLDTPTGRYGTKIILRTPTCTLTRSVGH